MNLLRKQRLHTDELIIYEISRAYANLADLGLIPKDLLIKSFMEQAPLLIHPNEWINKKTLEFCKIAYRSMTDADIFCRIRAPFKCYLKNRVLLMTHTDRFEDFIIAPVSRIIVDLIEANIEEDLPYTEKDANAKLIIGNILQELKKPDNSEDQYSKYRKYLHSLENTIKPTNLIRIEVTCNPDYAQKFAEKSNEKPAEKSIEKTPEKTSDKSAEKSKPVEKPLKNKIIACQPFYMRKAELEEYIDFGYDPFKVPKNKGYMIDNYEMNDSGPYKNYEKPTWKQAYELQSLCKPLHLYIQNEKNFYTESKEQIYLAQPTVDHRFKEWKPQGNLRVTLYNHSAPVSSIATSENSNLMATGSSDGVCYLWNTVELGRDIDLNPINKITVENKIRTLRLIEDERSVLIGTDQGSLYFSKIEETGTNKFYNKITNIMEGGLVDACPLRIGNSQNAVIYVTQRGVIHIYDLRVKRDSSRFSMDCQRGIITSACLGNDDYSLFLGTLGGYIGIYDIRFNLMSSLRKYACHTPISDLCTYSPIEPKSSPLIFAAPSTPYPHLDLFNLSTGETEWSFVAGKAPCTKIKKYLKVKEMHYTDTDLVILKRLSRKIPLEEESLMDEKMPGLGWANVYHQAAGNYDNQGSKLTRILCPRISQNGGSAPFLLTASADRVIRYLYFGGLDEKLMKEKSYIVNCPEDKVCTYVIDKNEPHVLRETIPVESACEMSKNGGGNGIYSIKSGESFKISQTSHSDSILDMALLDLSIDTFLVTASRDQTVKIWS